MEEEREEVKEEQEGVKEEQEGVEVMENTSSQNEDEGENEGEGDSDENAANQAKKKSIARRLMHFGNFKGYYDRRNSGSPADDRRLGIFRKEWFEGKDCLDIGCNCGIFTINIAEKFSCRSILGIDIDRKLVKRAKANLRQVAMSKPPPVNAPGEAYNVKDNDQAEDHPEQSVAVSSNVEENIPREPLEERNLLDIVSFKHENFITAKHPQEELYDTIMCLSVTQWIHLNWGDEGLITLFAKIWELLRPGGLFVLEPQRWKSYEKKHQLSVVTALNFNEIELFPEHFQEILLDKIGFRTVEYINPSWQGLQIRFNRPVLVFKK